MKPIHDIPAFENIPILVRAALNVPVENGVVTDDYRLRKALPTIEFLASRGACVILISHIDPPVLGDGRPRVGTETLAPVAEALKRLMRDVSFFGETVGERARAAVRALSPGQVLVLENLRRNAGETANDPVFAKELAALADVFVEDSFDTCHRAHASIVGVPALLPSYAGLLLEAEVAELSHALAPEKPALAVIGGAKFHTKQAVLRELLTRYEHVFVGGALANDFLKISGRDVGKSLTSDADPGAIKALMQNDRLVLPSDVLVVPHDAIGALDVRARARVSSVNDIHPDEAVLDVGPETLKNISTLVAHAKSVLWNGPLGNYENGFVDGTDGFARAVASCVAHSTIGGGDTVAAIEKLGLIQRYSFVSTGGGAMLSFLANGTLPGIAALG